MNLMLKIQIQFICIGSKGNIAHADDMQLHICIFVFKLFFIALHAGLNGRAKLEGYDVDAVITYEGK